MDSAVFTTRKRTVTRAALIALTAGLSLGASVAHAAIVDSGPVSIAIPATTAGIYLNVITGVSATMPGGAPGWDLNPWGSVLRQFFWPSTPAGSTGGLVAPSTTLPYLALAPGDTVGPSSTFSTGGTNTAVNFQAAGQRILGFRFLNESGNTVHYGYVVLESAAATGVPGNIIRYVYESTPNTAITVAAAGGGTTPPIFGYTPATGSTVAATGGTTIGSTGTLTITPSIATVGSGTGAAATTTLTCTAPTAPFAGFGQTVTAEGNDKGVTGGPLAGTCTLGATEATQTLTCSENQGGTAVSRQWTLSCPAGAVVNTPPNIGYNPSAGSNVAFSGVTTIGSTGNGTIVATPSGGSGSGPGATTTINTCTLGGANPSAFAGAAAINLSFVGDTTTPQNLALTCTSAATAQTATLTCNETRGDVPTGINGSLPNPIQRQWTLNCPAGTAAPSISLSKTVGTSPGVCATSSTLSVAPGTTVYYCYTVTNTGGATLNLHNLVDDQLGTIFSGLNFALTPGSSIDTVTAGLSIPAVITSTTTNLATWTAFNPGPVDQVTAQASATVTVLDAAPTIAYNPATGATVGFTGVTTIGTTGNGTIVATPSGGLGTGAGATTTINSCTLGGANPGSFAGAAAINLSFVGDTTTPQNLALTCTSAATAQTATLTCNETRGTAAPVQRQWPLNCPAGTPVAPTIAYNPATGATVGFTGVTTIGTTGNGSIAATPSGGLGTGAGATTTINTCTLGGANPGSFAGAAAINLSFVGNTTTPQNLALTCTSAATAQTATLTCNETRGTAAPVQRQWPLNCPAGTPVAPTIAYNPATGTPVGFTGVTTIGTTGNGSIAATPSGGLGTGAGATTTINTCTLGGANPGSFAGAAAINLSFVGNTTTPQNLALTCTSAATAQTATLTCNETRGTAAPVQRQWPLNCPAGALLPVSSTPVSGSTVNLTGVSGGNTGTSTITVTNPNPIAVSLTCTAPAFPFTASPLAFSIPAGGNAPVTVGLSPTVPGSYSGTLSCTVTGTSQVLTFSLAGTLVAPITVTATSIWSLLALMLALLGFALVAVRRQG